MAAVSEVITLGIGTPSDIPHFLTFGLSIGGAAVVYELPDDIIVATIESRVPERTLTFDGGVRTVEFSG